MRVEDQLAIVGVFGPGIEQFRQFADQVGVHFGFQFIPHQNLAVLEGI